MCGLFTLVELGSYSSVYVFDKTYMKIYDTSKNNLDYDELIKIHISLNTKVPNLIPKIYDINQEKDRIVIMMEKIEGITMEKFLEDKHSLTVISKVVISLVETILSFHKAGYLHNDLHGRNIIVDMDLSIKLIDFDITSEYDGRELEESGDYDYTKHYISLLIFPIDGENLSVHEVNELTRDMNVENVIDYETNTEIASSLYRLFKLFP